MYQLDTDEGVAWCQRVEGDTAYLLYTDLPGASEVERAVPSDRVRLATLRRGTRVWVPSNVFGWLTGEVTGHLSHGQYLVRVAGLPRDLPLSEHHLRVRWNRPLTDPIGAVANGFCDSPEYYEARRRFRDQLVRQRSVSCGFSAVLSAPIELYQHQLDTVARVLSDPVLRYLLADEVGLGKTIEAALVLRQLLLDDPKSTALVSVPVELMRQWSDELHDRLLLDAALDSGRLRLVSHDDLMVARNLREHALVVVDEAHRILPQLTRTPRLRQELLCTKGLVLLSATPMRGDLTAFLDLLNLVDPVAFPHHDLDGFQERVHQREKEAMDLQVLASHRASLRQRNAVLDDLLALHGADPVVARLVEECRSVGDPRSPTWSALASYVRETYRISRRMIRHRRNSVLTEGYPVAGRRATFVTVVDPARPIVDDFLDQYRYQLGERDARRSYAQAVMHGLAGPHVLMRHLERRLAARPGNPGEVPHQDRALLEATAARLRLADSDVRLRQALDLVQERLDHDRKVVVVSTSPEVAKEYMDLATVRWGGSVGAHLAGFDQATNANNVSSFLVAPGGRVLVGDYTLDEGRNLQGAQVLVNLDLPLDVNRLEQRIGRLDRFARQAEPAEIVVFVEPDSDWVTAYTRLLHKGVGVFDQSVATLQRRLAELLEDVLTRLQREGSRAFEMDLQDLRERLEAERTEVDLLEELESVMVASDFDDASLADLLDAERDVAGLRDAFAGLTSMRGGIGLRPLEDPTTGLVRFDVERKVIYGLPDDFAEEVRPLLRRPRAYGREATTNRRGVAPLRLGDPLVDWLARHLDADERGRARAVLRPYPGCQVPALWLACDFLVEFDAAQLPIEDDGVRRRLRRRGDALFPPAVVRTWTDPAGPAPTTLVEEVLSKAFDPNRDIVIRGQVWRDVLEALPDWQQLCRASGAVARDHIGTLPILTSTPAMATERAEQEIEARLAVLRARSQRLRSDAERAAAEHELGREESLGKALLQGVRRPSVSAIACGAVVLWPTA